MAGQQCPFCGMYIAIDSTTYERKYLTFNNIIEPCSLNRYLKSAIPILAIDIYSCPNCSEWYVKAEGINGCVKSINTNINPIFNYINFPDYIPYSIRTDYKEACGVKKN